MEQVTAIVVDALRRALAEPVEHRLYKSGKLDGLFPGRAGANGSVAGVHHWAGGIAPLQKTIFRLNCNSRISIPARRLLMVPNAPVPGIATPAAFTALLLMDALGSPKFG